MPNFRLEQTLVIKKKYFKIKQINFHKEKSKFIFKECDFSAKSVHVVPNFRLEQTLVIKKTYF